MDRVAIPSAKTIIQTIATKEEICRATFFRIVNKSTVQISFELNGGTVILLPNEDAYYISSVPISGTINFKATSGVDAVAIKIYKTELE